MQLADCQYAIDKASRWYAGAFTPFDWEFQEEAVSSDINQNRDLRDFSFSSPPQYHLTLPRDRKKMINANRQVFYLSDR